MRGIAIPPRGADARVLAVESDHPAVRDAVIAFVGSDHPAQWAPRIKPIVSASPHTRRPAALPRRWSWPRRASCLLASRWLLAIRLCLLWQPGGLGRPGGSVPFVAVSRAPPELCRFDWLHMQRRFGCSGAEALLGSSRAWSTLSQRRHSASPARARARRKAAVSAHVRDALFAVHTGSRRSAREDYLTFAPRRLCDPAGGLWTITRPRRACLMRLRATRPRLHWAVFRLARAAWSVTSCRVAAGRCSPGRP